MIFQNHFHCRITSSLPNHANWLPFTVHKSHKQYQHLATHHGEALDLVEARTGLDVGGGYDRDETLHVARQHLREDLPQLLMIALECVEVGPTLIPPARSRRPVSWSCSDSGRRRLLLLAAFTVMRVADGWSKKEQV